MMNNQRGGILSKVFVIPAGVALMVAFFFLGYYVGKYQSKPIADRTLPPLPEIGREQTPKQEEFTFYKTLTEKENKPVAIDVRPKKKAPELEQSGGTGRSDAENKIEIKLPKPSEGQSGERKKVEIKLNKPGDAKSSEPRTAVPGQKTGKDAHTPPTNIRYTIQIASYNKREAAEEEVKRMKKRGYAAFIVSSELPEKGTWYRVRLGSFSSKQAAERLLNELKEKEGLSPFVTIE